MTVGKECVCDPQTRRRFAKTHRAIVWVSGVTGKTTIIDARDKPPRVTGQTIDQASDSNLGICFGAYPG